MVDAARIAPQPTIDGPLPVCKGYQQLALTSATSLTIPNGTTMVLLQAEAVAVRWRADGVDPTTSVGMLIAAGGEVLYSAGLSALSALRFIHAGAGAILNVSYY